MGPRRNSASDLERELQSRFSKEQPTGRMPSTAHAPPDSPRVEDLVLPDEARGKMPLTKDKYLVKENPHLVQWEREVRKFLRNLSPEHGHRVTASMIYEWATGIRVVDIMAQTKDRLKPGYQNYRTDLSKIRRILTFYFGKPYTTWIAGRKVDNAFKIKPGYYIRRHRPMTLTLWVECHEGTLYP